MVENMTAARPAADEETDGVHDYPHSTNFRHYHDRKQFDDDPFSMLNSGTDGFLFFQQDGFEGWPWSLHPH